MVTHPDSQPPCFSSRTISAPNPCNTCSAILSSEYLLSKQNDTSPGPIKRTYMCLPNFQHPTLPNSSTRHCNTPSAHNYQRPKHDEKLRHAGHTLFRGPQLLFAACHSRLYTQLSTAVCRTLVALAIPTTWYWHPCPGVLLSLNLSKGAQLVAQLSGQPGAVTTPLVLYNNSNGADHTCMDVAGNRHVTALKCCTS